MLRGAFAIIRKICYGKGLDQVLDLSRGEELLV